MEYTYPPEHIYTLSDPRDNSVRYVGVTTDVINRYHHHMVTTVRGNPEKEAWIQELRRLEMKPIMTVIETINHEDDASPRQRERYWIHFYQSQGAKLYNKNKRLEFMPPIIFANEIPTLEKENAQLRAENARLRSIIDQIAQLTGTDGF